MPTRTTLIIATLILSSLLLGGNPPMAIPEEGSLTRIGISFDLSQGMSSSSD